MYPFEFDYLWALRNDDGMTAAALAEHVSRPTHSYPRHSRWIANSLRGLVRRGYVVGEGKPMVYRLTERGRAYVDG